jgi:hypothetical protein
MNFIDFLISVFENVILKILNTFWRHHYEPSRESAKFSTTCSTNQTCLSYSHHLLHYWLATGFSFCCTHTHSKMQCIVFLFAGKFGKQIMNEKYIKLLFCWISVRNYFWNRSSSPSFQVFYKDKCSGLCNIAVCWRIFSPAARISRGYMCWQWWMIACFIEMHTGCNWLFI